MSLYCPSPLSTRKLDPFLFFVLTVSSSLVHLFEMCLSFVAFLACHFFCPILFLSLVLVTKVIPLFTSESQLCLLPCQHTAHVWVSFWKWSFFYRMLFSMSSFNLPYQCLLDLYRNTIAWSSSFMWFSASFNCSSVAGVTTSFTNTAFAAILHLPNLNPNLVHKLQIAIYWSLNSPGYLDTSFVVNSCEWYGP